MKVLVVEDAAGKYSKIEKELRNCRISMICREKTLEDAKRKIEQSCQEKDMFDVIVTDMQFPAGRGLGELTDAGFRLIDFVNSLSLHIPMIICSSGRYPVNKENVLGSLHYSDNADWEAELRNLIGTIPSPQKQ